MDRGQLADVSGGPKPILSSMGLRYHHLVFGDRTLDRQRTAGSIVAYGADLADADEGPQLLTGREIALLVNSFQFHLATVSPTGWPYIQYRSGPKGFLHHLGGQQLGFADHHGNEQFVTVGNIESDGRVAMFVADLPTRTRLKVFGTATVIDAQQDPELLERLRSLDGGGRVAARCDRSIVIDVQAFDWNCRRSMVPQYTEEQVRARVQPYIDEVAALRAELDGLRQSDR